jgi:hypothetical protein
MLWLQAPIAVDRLVRPRGAGARHAEGHEKTTLHGIVPSGTGQSGSRLPGHEEADVGIGRLLTEAVGQWDGAYLLEDLGRL